MRHFDRFLAIESDLLEFRDFDKWMQTSLNKLPASYKPKSAQQIAHLLFGASRNCFFMMRVTSLKLFEIGRGIASSYKENNASVFLSLARSFVEHTASLSYQRDILEKATTKLTTANQYEGIETIIMKMQSEITELFYGSSDKSKTASFVHVNDMMKVMKRDIKEIDATYGYLCDFVHPNYGSNRLVSSGIIGQGILLPEFFSYKEEIDRAGSAVDECASYAMQCQIDISKRLIELGSWVDIAIKPETRISQIFSIKTQYNGDGKSRRTAISFDNARSHVEAMLALNNYLKTTNTVIFSRDRKRFKDGYYYERLETNNGFIWVRFLTE